MKPNILILATILTMALMGTSCRKQASDIAIENCSSANNPGSVTNDLHADNPVTITEIPLSFAIINPCCLEQVYFTGTIHRVENSNVIHMDSRTISGVGLTSGLNYTVQSTSVRNYQFDPNQNLATVNWSMRMKREDGCGYNVQFVIHVTRDAGGEIIANIHSGNFFCF